MYHFLQKLISSLRPSSTNANLLQRVPPFVFYLFYVSYKTGRLQRVIFFDPFHFFSALCELFSKIFNVSKESPLRIFWYFATDSMLMNPKGSPLFIFRHYATFSKFFFKKNFSRKIFKKIFKFFCFQSGKVIFQSYRAWKAHFGCLESVFKAFHEYILGIFRKLCAFWALDIAPTLDVPVLFFVRWSNLSEWSTFQTFCLGFFGYFTKDLWLIYLFAENMKPYMTRVFFSNVIFWKFQVSLTISSPPLNIFRHSWDFRICFVIFV